MPEHTTFSLLGLPGNVCELSLFHGSSGRRVLIISGPALVPSWET